MVDIKERPNAHSSFHCRDLDLKRVTNKRIASGTLSKYLSVPPRFLGAAGCRGGVQAKIVSHFVRIDPNPYADTYFAFASVFI
jgi:hypothetical protein